MIPKNPVLDSIVTQLKIMAYNSSRLASLAAIKGNGGEACRLGGEAEGLRKARKYIESVIEGKS